MNKWLKKKFEQLAAKLNADDETFDESNDIKESADKEHKTHITGGSLLSRNKVQNIEELKELSVGAITNAVRLLGYGNAVVSGLCFHSRFADNAVENVGLQTLIKDDEFLKQIKRAFKSKGIQYKENLKVEVKHDSALADRVTSITEGIGVEVLTPTEILKTIKAKLIATEGITWEDEYVLESGEKTYFIGRCKNPKIENGPKIHNDIAFVGIEEKEDEQYKINNYVSRSHATIVYDKDLGAYKIYRSRFLNNPSHKIKIYNTSMNDFSGVSLTQAAVPHVLKDGDSICLNDKVVLEFSIIK
ncbi:MAG TPA: hypothetical protein PK191_06835 [Niabella sp.]|nr:hypothetical protein [Niabella sp.]HOZ95732.1 hypothetical protein [Niabella sp.]HQW15975.1 hypothetical protein [Niabella sp.]HQX21172.1 hypothetical protein [Niabella sp.]HQX40737.1 hypothetical protein [Niabella sp.]